MGSRNWFVIHESRSLNSNPEIYLSFFLKLVYNLVSMFFYCICDIFILPLIPSLSLAMFLTCSLKLVSAIFYQILFFHQMIALQKLWKMFFISSKKLFSSSGYSHFCIFSLPFYTPQTQRDKWKWNNLWCHELACINLQI